MTSYYEDLRIGEAAALGEHTFTREAIIAFARKFDPQPFHLDEEAGRASIFGSLVASGWHTASVCMRKLIDWREAERARSAARGETLAPLGVSPGFKNLRWPNPVRPGDVVAYSLETESMRETRRPQWGLVGNRFRGVNQDGLEVLTFSSLVLMARRPT